MKKVFVLGLILSFGLMVGCTNNSTVKVDKELEEAREEAITELTNILREIQEEINRENKIKMQDMKEELRSINNSNF